MKPTRGRCIAIALALATTAACGGKGGAAHPAKNKPPDVGHAVEPGDAIVADNGGRLIAVNPRTGAKKTISDNDRSAAAGGQALFGDLFGVGREADGNFVVIARFPGEPPLVFASAPDPDAPGVYPEHERYQPPRPPQNPS